MNDATTSGTLNALVRFFLAIPDQVQAFLALSVMAAGILTFLAAGRSLIRQLQPRALPPDTFRRLRNNLDRDPDSPPPGKGFFLILIIVILSLLAAWFRASFK